MTPDPVTTAVGGPIEDRPSVAPVAPVVHVAPVAPSRWQRFRRRLPERFLRTHPYLADGLLALGIAALAFASGVNPDGHTYRGNDAYSIGLTAIVVALVVVRRRFPVLLLLAAAGAALLLTAANYNANATAFPALVGVYSVAAHRPRRVSLWALVAVPVVIVALFTIDPAVSGVPVAGLVGNTAVFAAAWFLGDNLQTRRQYVATLEERAARLEREREQEAERAVAYERARIARELHDVVAHHVGVMVVQAAAARRVLGRDPQEADAALETVEATGREAMREMRAMLGVLRDEDERAERDPQPGVSSLDALVAQVRDAGLDVTYEVVGDVRPLPQGVDLSVYRIVQEALTNVLKHGGPGVHVRVRLRYRDGAVDVDVIDDGRGAAADVSVSQGHGIVGMRERAQLYGGTLRVGPRPGGGYVVAACFPV